MNIYEMTNYDKTSFLTVSKISIQLVNTTYTMKCIDVDPRFNYDDFFADDIEVNDQYDSSYVLPEDKNST